jgi:hypothetical protein
MEKKCFVFNIVGLRIFDKLTGETQDTGDIEPLL